MRERVAGVDVADAGSVKETDVSSVVLTVRLAAVGASLTGEMTITIAPVVVAVPSETVYATVSVPLEFAVATKEQAPPPHCTTSEPKRRRSGRSS